MTKENLLSWQVMKIFYENGTKYLIPNEEEGFNRLREVLSAYLQSESATLDTVTVSQYRALYKKTWDDILDDLVPFEARDRVTKEFKTLIF